MRVGSVVEGAGTGRARRDEAGESEGGISSERLSNISGLFERGELGVLTFALSRPSGCSQVMQSPHTYSVGGRQCVIHLASKRLDG